MVGYKLVTVSKKLAANISGLGTSDLNAMKGNIKQNISPRDNDFPLCTI